MRIAVYGGTFDPPHEAHLAIARAALAQGVAERALFVPAADPPHKTASRLTPFADRLAMIRLAIAGEPRFSVSCLERDRLPRRSYTIDTMDALAAESPADEFILLIGSDSLAALHTWDRARELVERHSLAVYPRKGEVPSLADLRVHWPEEQAKRLHSAIIKGVEEMDLSSSSLRSGLANSENAARFIPAAVLDYIRSRSLYR